MSNTKDGMREIMKAWDNLLKPPDCLMLDRGLGIIGLQ